MRLRSPTALEEAQLTYLRHMLPRPRSGSNLPCSVWESRNDLSFTASVISTAHTAPLWLGKIYSHFAFYLEFPKNVFLAVFGWVYFICKNPGSKLAFLYDIIKTSVLCSTVLYQSEPSPFRKKYIFLLPRCTNIYF
jgi:hypothetical protein